MIDNRTENKNYPLPNPQNIASQDVGRIADAISMIDADLGNANESINNIYDAVENLNEKSLKIPEALVGSFETELQNVAPRKYVVVNDEGNGFSTVEGGGGDGGKKGEVLIKNSDENFDTTWIDPRAILRKTATTKETISDIQLPNNGSIILKDSLEINFPEDLPQRGLSPIQISGDATADSFVGYILKDEIEEAEEDNDFASKTKFGRVKIGSGIDVENGVISVPKIGIASKENFGIVKIGEGFDVSKGVISAKEYQQASHENYGIIKLSDDFRIGTDGELLLANKIDADEIIYQMGRIKAVENGVVSVESTCAKYRAYIEENTTFEIDLSQIKQTSDLGFELEVVADDFYEISFAGISIEWLLPCQGAVPGSVVIRFRKELGSEILFATLVSSDSAPVQCLTSDSGDDIQENCIYYSNGMSANPSWAVTPRGDYWAYNYANLNSGIGEALWHVDFAKSTCVTSLYVSDNPVHEYFYLEGSIDKENWITLLEKGKDESLQGRHECSTRGHFRYFRIRTSSPFTINYWQLFGFQIGGNKISLTKVMPEMTANSLENFVITSSGTNKGELFNLTTNSTGSFANFNTRDEKSEYWIKYELAEAAIVNMFDIGACTSNSDRMPLRFKILASNDDENWDLLLETSSLNRWYDGETRQYYIPDNGPYKYFKLVPIELQTTEFRIARFRLYRKI